MKIGKNFRKVGSILALCLAPTLANAGEWKNATTTYKTDNTSTVKLQRGTENSYGFLNLYGDDKFNLESMYGEVRVRKPLGKGFSLGAEYNGGTGVKDIVRPHIAYTNKFGPVFVDTKFSPVETSRSKGSQLGLYASTSLKKLGLEGWVDLDYSDKKVTPSGEMEASYKIGKDLSLVLRGEKYPWQKSPQFSGGVKLSL